MYMTLPFSKCSLNLNNYSVPVGCTLVQFSFSFQNFASESQKQQPGLCVLRLCSILLPYADFHSLFPYLWVSLTLVWNSHFTGCLFLVFNTHLEQHRKLSWSRLQLPFLILLKDEKPLISRFSSIEQQYATHEYRDVWNIYSHPLKLTQCSDGPSSYWLMVLKFGRAN